MIFNFYTDLTPASNQNAPIAKSHNEFLLNWMTPQYYEDDRGAVLVQKFTSLHFRALLIAGDLNAGIVFHTQVEKDWCCVQYMFEDESIISPPDKVPFRVKKDQISPLSCSGERLPVYTFPGRVRLMQLHIHKDAFKEWEMDTKAWKGMLEQWDVYAAENNIYKSVSTDARVKFWMNRIIRSVKTEEEVLSELKDLFQNLIILYMELRADAAYLAGLLVKPFYRYTLDIWKAMRAQPDKTRFKLVNLAKEYHQTPKNISIHYKQIFGEAISDALHNRCMERAVYWLSNTDRDFESISQELGYQNKTSLYNALKERFDTTVEQIRNKV